MSFQLYRDPTCDGAMALENKEEECRTCIRRINIFSGVIRCGVGYSNNSCHAKPDGFVLDVDFKI